MCAVSNMLDTKRRVTYKPIFKNYQWFIDVLAVQEYSHHIREMDIATAKIPTGLLFFLLIKSKVGCQFTSCGHDLEVNCEAEGTLRGLTVPVGDTTLLPVIRWLNLERNILFR